LSTPVAKALPLFLASFLAVSVCLTADPLIFRAQQLEKAGDTEGAARLYAAWLQANSGAPGGAQVFSRYFRMEHDFLALRDASLRLLAVGHGMPGAADQFAAIARLFEIGGLTGEARDAYLGAYGEGAGDSSLVSAFLLSLQMHDTDAMAKCLAALESRGGAAAPLLRALSDIQAGHGESAGAALARLADSSGDPDVVLKARWVMYARAKAAEDQKGQADARARLSADFPGAPEAALVSPLRTATVVLFPSPDIFVTGDSPAESPPAPKTAEPAQVPAGPPVTSQAAPGQTAAGPVQTAPAPPTTEPAAVSVQAGSFRVRENADDLSAELSKRGFSPIQKMETIQGRDHYRVFAGVGLDAAQARALLAKLLQQGFSGILVTEK
jgi:cell division septation protein DedD